MELVQCIICVSAASVHLRRRRSAWSVVRLCHHDIHRILRVLRRSHHSHRHQTIFVLLAMSRCHFVRLKNATFSHRLKMVNGSRYYTALESVSMASALSSALTIFPCQIRVYQRGQSKLQLPTARKKEWWPATADSFTPAGHLSTVIHTTLAGIEPTTFRLLVRRATSCATETTIT